MPSTLRTRSALVVALLSILGTTAACAPPPSTPTNPPTVVVDVSPGSTPSGITVAPGQKVTVRGTGFTTTGNLGTRPPLSGQPAGVYVTFGRFATNWKPSSGAPSGSRQIIEQLWALPTSSYNALGGIDGLVQMSPTGSFTVELTAAPATGTNPDYGIALYPGSGASNPAEEIFVPVTFSGT